jgi:hypothetical protein
MTCLITRMTLRLLVVLSAVAHAALPTAMTTVIAPGALSFALIQDACARQFRRHPDERHPAAWSRDLPGTPRRNQGSHGAPRTALNKTRPQPGDGVSAFLCNFLDDHGPGSAVMACQLRAIVSVKLRLHPCQEIHPFSHVLGLPSLSLLAALLRFFCARTSSPQRWMRQLSVFYRRPHPRSSAYYSWRSTG